MDLTEAKTAEARYCSFRKQWVEDKQSETLGHKSVCTHGSRNVKINTGKVLERDIHIYFFSPEEKDNKYPQSQITPSKSCSCFYSF